MKIIDTDSTLF